MDSVAPCRSPWRCSERWRRGPQRISTRPRSEEHTSELQSQSNLVCRLLLEKKKHYAVELLHLRIALADVGEASALYILIVVIKRTLTTIEPVPVSSEELRLNVSLQAKQILI